jgi:hypothetical protein
MAKEKSKETLPESKPAQLAKIIYAGIVRMMKAKEARNGEKDTKFELDSDRKRRVNRHTKEYCHHGE